MPGAGPWTSASTSICRSGRPGRSRRSSTCMAAPGRRETGPSSSRSFSTRSRAASPLPRPTTAFRARRSGRHNCTMSAPPCAGCGAMPGRMVSIPGAYIVFGVSAGGHLACMLGTAGDKGMPEDGAEEEVRATPDAVVALYPPTDFLRARADRAALHAGAVAPLTAITAHRRADPRGGREDRQRQSHPLDRRKRAAVPSASMATWTASSTAARASFSNRP